MLTLIAKLSMYDLATIAFIIVIALLIGIFIGSNETNT
jgi:hypothetical protein